MAEYINAAFELFSQKGFFLTSVDDIVQKAGRSKGGFYYHFKSKNDLLSHLFHKLMKEYSDILLEEMKSGKPLEQAFNSYIANKAVQAVLSSHYLKAIAEIYTVALRDRSTLALLRHFYRDSVDFFAQVLEIGKKRGELSFPESSREMAEMIFCEIRGSFLINIIVHNGRQLDFMTDFFKSYIKRLVRALKPE